MPTNSLDNFTTKVHAVWASLSTELIDDCRSLMEDFVKRADVEPWLDALYRDRPGSKELYRDPDHDFVLLAHSEGQGVIRTPHDHGRSWVMYSVQRGEMEHRTYARVVDENGHVRLVLRDTYTMRRGMVKVYLPGDIHETRCLSDDALYYRFTSRDLKKDEGEGYKVTRYVEGNGFWTL